MTLFVRIHYFYRMKVTIEYMGFFKIENVPSRTVLETKQNTTVGELLDTLQVKKEHRNHMVPLINRKRRTFDTPLADGDKLFLYFPVGGG